MQTAATCKQIMCFQGETTAIFYFFVYLSAGPCPRHSFEHCNQHALIYRPLQAQDPVRATFLKTAASMRDPSSVASTGPCPRNFLEDLQLACSNPASVASTGPWPRNFLEDCSRHALIHSLSQARDPVRATFLKAAACMQQAIMRRKHRALSAQLPGRLQPPCSNPARVASTGPCPRNFLEDKSCVVAGKATAVFLFASCPSIRLNYRIGSEMSPFGLLLAAFWQPLGGISRRASPRNPLGVPWEALGPPCEAFWVPFWGGGRGPRYLDF